MLAHDRKIVHFNRTEHPTAERTARQWVQAFDDRKPPHFLVRDRDGIYGTVFRELVKTLDIEEILIAPRSPWQSPYVERVIGNPRRECLDHVIIFGDAHLIRMIRTFLIYYHGARIHLALGKDAPVPRAVQPGRGWNQ